MRGRFLGAATAAALLLGGSISGTAMAQSAVAPPTVPAPTSNVAAIAAGLTGTAPANVTVSLSAASGGVVLAGNTGISIPPGAFGGITGNVTVQITANPPSLSSINAGGPSQFSPNGTILDVNIVANGVHITTFPQPLTIVTKPNGADLAMAGGNLSSLTLAYVIDADSPPGENPNGYPINTLVIEPPSAVVVDPTSGTVSANVNFLGSVIGVVTNPVGYVQVLNPDATEYSSFDSNNSQQFSQPGQFTFLQVTEPQIGGRLLVIDPTTNNYAYVNASDVGPSGPPPAKSSAAVVRGLLGGTA